MSQATKKSLTLTLTLTLPRPLVNKILAHAQQSADNESNEISCGIISNDAQGNKFYHPILSFITQTTHPACFKKSNAAYQKTIQQLTDKQQQILAYVFNSSKKIKTTEVDNNLFPINQSYYIMNFLDTKGVLSMQGIYRNNEIMQEVELALAE